jgi:hypothetical protein
MSPRWAVGARARTRCLHANKPAHARQDPSFTCKQPLARARAHCLHANNPRACAKTRCLHANNPRVALMCVAADRVRVRSAFRAQQVLARNPLFTCKRPRPRAPRPVVYMQTTPVRAPGPVVYMQTTPACARTRCLRANTPRAGNDPVARAATKSVRAVPCWHSDNAGGALGPRSPRHGATRSAGASRLTALLV